MKSHSESYKKAGVDITAGYRAVELIKKHIARTHIKGVASDIGGFGGLFELDLSGYENPILVSGTDGVGTKLKLAFTLDKHDTIGIDCVAMCVNDIVCSGARPLFFLDYLAVGKNYPEKIERIVAGVAEGCVQAGCALIGGETAEMPGFYRDGEYDLAGFAVGIVDKKKMLDSSKVKVGDVIIGLPSSGIHSNGFSLVRKIIGDAGLDLTSYSQYTDSILGDALLAPTKIYVKPVLSLIEKVNVKSVAHITGGGFYENIPRALPDGIMAKIEKSVIKVPPIFKLLQEEGAVPERDMFNIFNMGIGMCVIVAKKDADKALEILKEAGEDAYIIGETVKGSGVDLC
ncbi:MAG TPA: phosphoribosylformylglycinamidine cyclo-ligase [Clostridiales bacterium]|jgi:phosphoribosylformylglycinamidine cyclo-ligase|nr:phosphoribosylformylglycinamidine cyclo-ligase [Clostridiales bacterium]HOJ35940.1 phosphoribosylformylglycinamidine cyclo-ligase [Clostridiales bacterium]HOL78678.1 phosphoribosylformylglycinamidine cyclo-ligase [Clostridiales bacterium]HPP67486.1 phosphoribosylformylglycinamidine cyclo-ligase [Clostridiales bacterium]HQA05704.1 phosphoribosylformylglycinamidine cyclo-ligase [Clostridiales bacterium]